MSATPIIDSDSCTGCGICVRDCPRQILTLEGGTVKIRAENCMLCSHCYCVCPEEAIAFPPGTLSETVLKTVGCGPTPAAAGEMDAARLVNSIRSRRSVRRFKDAPVPREVISDLVEFASTAPSGTNCKSWEFTIVQGGKEVANLATMMRDFYSRLNKMASNPMIRLLSIPFAGKKLFKYHREREPRVAHILKEAGAGNDLFLWNAAAVIIIHSGMEGSTPVEDAQYAAYNITLLAHSLGLGTCFIGYAREAINRDRTIRNYLRIPASNTAHAVLVSGYRDVEYLRLPLNKPHKIAWV